MANFEAKELDLSSINGGQRYQNGDVVDAEAINAPIEAAAFAQSIATNQPNIENIGNTGNPSVSIEHMPDGGARFVFSNLKGETAPIVQTTGDREDAVMSQKAVTNELGALPIRHGGGEHSIIQCDGENLGSSGTNQGVDDGKSNWTNATHAAVFGNNNRVIQTTEKGNDGRNSSIGGGLGNKIYAPNSFIGAGEYNEIGSGTVERVRSAIVGGNYNKIYGSNSFIGGGEYNEIAISQDELLGSVILGGSNNKVTGQGNFIAAGNNSVIDGSGSVSIGYDNEITGYVNAAIGRYNQIGNSKNTTKRTFAIGYGLSSLTDYQTLLGKWNAIDTGACLIIGGGTSDTKRENLYTLRESGTPSIGTDLVPKRYADALADTKLDKVTAAERIYGTNAFSEQTTYQLSELNIKNTIAFRDSNGNVRTSHPSFYSDAVNLSYFNDEIGTATAAALNAKADKSYVDTVILDGEW